MGATPDVLPLVRQYMTIWYTGVFFVMIPMVGNNAIRATGDTKTPSAIMLVAVVVNITMDPLLIFGLGPFPRLELAGAALATVLARASTFLAAIWVLYYRDKMVTLIRPRLHDVLVSWRQILYIGLPTAGSNMILPIGIGVITRLLATHSTAAVAAFGVATRIEMVALMVIMALAGVLGPFVGQNWGANRFDRVKRSVQCSQGFSFGWGLFTLTMLAIFARPVAGLFDDNPAVIAKVILYLRVVPFGYGMQGILMLSTISLNVLNRPLQAAGLTILQMFILYIPLAHLGSYLWAVPGIFAAAATANIIAGSTAFLWLRRVLKIERQAEMSQIAVPESV
jgi:Na+-driven multidrug efflux pump